MWPLPCDGRRLGRGRGGRRRGGGAAPKTRAAQGGPPPLATPLQKRKSFSQMITNRARQANRRTRNTKSIARSTDTPQQTDTENAKHHRQASCKVRPTDSTDNQSSSMDSPQLTEQPHSKNRPEQRHRPYCKANRQMITDSRPSPLDDRKKQNEHHVM